MAAMAEKLSTLDPFSQLDQFVPAISDLFTQIKLKAPLARQKIAEIVEDITEMAEVAPNATLAAIHLSRQQSPVKQSVYSTVLAYRMARVLKLDDTTRQNLLYAVLTCNMTFYEYQVLLNTIQGKLTDAQIQKLQKHPLQAAQHMEDAGFSHPDLIKAIRQHHERLDGSGYPNRISGNALSPLALIIQICETYTARIDHRAYRKAGNPREALAPLIADQNPRMKEMLLIFARAIGIYPPGTWVKLTSQEIALVVAHQPSQPIPEVRALFNSSGLPYAGPLKRDCTLAEFKILGSTTPPSLPSVDLAAMF
ncbi:Hypothetical protein HDN1F_33050 [gamma proteobacterium HdN1]|nr:Hypothetical protein HDN1F_33050 [gamma proteobacterium HdN1]